MAGFINPSVFAAMQNPRTQQAFAPMLQQLGQMSQQRQQQRRQDQLLSDQRMREDEQLALENERRQVVGQATSFLNMPSHQDRVSGLAGLAQQTNDPELREEYARMAQMDENMLIRELQDDLVSAGGDVKSLMPQGAKVGRIRYIDTGANIEARDTSDNTLLEVIPKTTPEGRRRKEELDAQKKEVELEEKALKVSEKRREIANAAQSVIEQANTGLQLISDIESHPGFSDIVGFKGPATLFGLMEEPMGGTEAAGAKALIDTLESQNFIAGIRQFKSAGGAGALSDSEGKKLASAITSLKTSQSEADFKRNLNVVKQLLKKQAAKAQRDIPKGYTPAESTAQPAAASDLSDEDLFK